MAKHRGLKIGKKRGGKKSRKGTSIVPSHLMHKSLTKTAGRKHTSRKRA